MTGTSQAKNRDFVPISYKGSCQRGLGRYTVAEVDNETMGEIVRRERERRGWTQAALAARVGVQAQTILNLENGKTRTLKLGKLPALAGALELPLDRIIALSRPTVAATPLPGRLPELLKAACALINRLEQREDTDPQALGEALRVLGNELLVMPKYGKLLGGVSPPRPPAAQTKADGKSQGSKRRRRRRNRPSPDGTARG
jgi:transcriptional regulator with XRE-family HTH domain